MARYIAAGPAHVERNGGHHEPTSVCLAGLSRDFERKESETRSAVLGHYASEHFIVSRTA
jgi:hypothetical protein